MICKAMAAKGKACQAKAMAGSHFCFFHDPTYRARRLDAQRKGGSSLKSHVQTPLNPPFEVDLGEPLNIIRLLSFVANCFVRSEVDAKAVHGFCHLADSALRAHNLENVLNRLEELQRLQQSESVEPLRTRDYHSMFDEDDAPGEADRPLPQIGEPMQDINRPAPKNLQKDGNCNDQNA